MNMMYIWLYYAICCLLQYFLLMEAVVVDENFFQSCRIGNLTKVVEYIESGIPVSSRDGKGNTGIIIASGRGQIDVIKYLLANGANVDDYTSIGLFEGKSALSWACSQGRTETVALLIKAGANLHKPPDRGVFQGKTAFMWASSQGRTEVVKLLLSAGVDVDYSSQNGNFRGKSALMWASSQGRLETVKLLLEAGSNVNAVDNDGVSALMWAAGSEAADEDGHRKGLLERATKGHMEVVKQLLKYGAEADLKDKDGITAIMFACYHGHDAAVKVLLNYGANADLMNKNEKTALQLARNAGHNAAVQTILNGPSFMEAEWEDLKDLPVCGWLLHVLRLPKGTGIYPVRNSRDLLTSSGNYSFASCDVIHQNGLDSNMFDLIGIILGSTDIESVVELFGPMNYATKVRASMQLKVLVDRFADTVANEMGYSRDRTAERCCSMKEIVECVGKCGKEMNQTTTQSCFVH